MLIKIGRTSGPCTDVDVESDFDPSQLGTIKDVLAIINKATNGKEDWYVIVDDGGTIIPELR